MDKSRLGVTGPEVSRVALGCMAMSGVYGPVGDKESICTIQEAIDQGINLLDTGDFYGMGHNEMLVGRAIQDRRDKVVLSVKFGAMRTPSGGWVGYDARPAAVKNFLAYSLRRLGVEYIDVYRPARLDSKVPIEESVGAIAELIKEGYVRHIGLSEMSAETVRRGNAVHPIVDLQMEYSLVSRGVERSILPALREMGIGFTAYGLLSRGLLSGSKPSSPRDIRAHYPRFAGENLQTNAKLVATLNRIAKENNVSGPQLAVSWVLHRGTDIVPLLGPRTREQLRELLGALRVNLSAEELSRIEQAMPAESVAGTRYEAGQMAVLDSERAAKATS
jgi:aryl-alcohol dehydrogenase-like predicted oxidoreductase